MPAPNEAYYRANEADWRGVFEFVLTDWPAFRASKMSFLDRLRVLFMAYGPKLLGRFTIETSVRVSMGAPEGDVVHTTRVAKFGMPLMQGVEWVSLDPDGKHARFRCEHREGPTFWKVRRFEGNAEVAEDAMSVKYTFAPWYGTTLHQTGEIRGRDTVLTQSTAWFRGVQHLQRR